LTYISETNYARGIRQWNKVNRFVKKGSKAIYIIVPYFKKEPVEEEEGKDGCKILKGFMARAVFRYEDTDGEELDYKQIQMPELPFIEKAKEWGIKVEIIGGNNHCYGYYSPRREVIALASPEEKVFFHELAHASHKRIDKNFNELKMSAKEIIADFTAQVLCRIVGKKYEQNLGETYGYITKYASKMQMSAHSAGLKLISDVEKVLDNILGKEHANVQPED
jgi:hypothetical protein